MRFFKIQTKSARYQTLLIQNSATVGQFPIYPIKAIFPANRNTKDKKLAIVMI
jgi:hypothetical protein